MYICGNPSAACSSTSLANSAFHCAIAVRTCAIEATSMGRRPREHLCPTPSASTASSASWKPCLQVAQSWDAIQRMGAILTRCIAANVWRNSECSAIRKSEPLFRREVSNCGRLNSSRMDTEPLLRVPLQGEFTLTGYAGRRARIVVSQSNSRLVHNLITGGVMEKLLPEQLKDFWQAVVRQEHTAEEYTQTYDRALAEYRHTWERALLLD